MAVACTPPSPAREPVPEAGANRGLREIPLTILSRNRTHRFTVEVAMTAKEQSTGMMFRRSLQPKRGMIFPYAPAQPVGFWMKNTLIPLDLLFIREDGTIANIATAAPLSLDLVYSSGPVAAVLEIPGGRAAELGIREGDRAVFAL